MYEEEIVIRLLRYHTKEPKARSTQEILALQGNIQMLFEQEAEILKYQIREIKSIKN